MTNPDERLFKLMVRQARLRRARQIAVTIAVVAGWPIAALLALALVLVSR